MLLIHPTVEEKLALTREFMNQLDRAAWKINSALGFRVALEAKLEYLRTYGCKVESPLAEGSIDVFKSIVFVYPDPYPNCFSLVWAKRDEFDRSVTGINDLYFDVLAMRYTKRYMTGGLIYHGPKSVEDFNANPAWTDNIWMTHT